MNPKRTDIIQQIRTASDELLKITIRYDYKEGENVNKTDIEKARSKERQRRPRKRLYDSCVTYLP